MLPGATEAVHDRRRLPSYFLLYDDCARYNPRDCAPELQLQQVSVCSRAGASTLSVADDPGYTPVRAFTSRGLLFVDIGQGDVTVVTGAAEVRIFAGVGGARGQRQLARAVSALRRVDSRDGAAAHAGPS